MKNKSNWKNCKSKKRYDTFDEAMKFGKRHWDKGQYTCYYCSHCDGYHITTHMETLQQRSWQK